MTFCIFQYNHSVAYDRVAAVILILPIKTPSAPKMRKALVKCINIVIPKIEYKVTGKSDFAPDFCCHIRLR